MKSAFFKQCRTCHRRMLEPVYRLETLSELMACSCIVLPVNL